jgi:molecular chaperone DnaK
LNAAKDALKGSNFSEIKSTKEALTTASHKLAEAVYKASQAQDAQGVGNQQQGQSQSDAQQTAGNEGKVVDAEVVDGNKDNK